MTHTRDRIAAACGAIDTALEVLEHDADVAAGGPLATVAEQLEAAATELRAIPPPMEFAAAAAAHELDAVVALRRLEQQGIPSALVLATVAQAHATLAASLRVAALADAFMGPDGYVYVRAEVNG